MLGTSKFTTSVYEDSACPTLGSSASLRLGDFCVVAAISNNEDRYSTIPNPKSAISVAYDPANQLLSSVTGSAITTNTYDPNGNLLASNAAGALTTNTWDDENRLIVMATPDGNVTTNTYAADGQRRRKDTNSGSILYLYDGVNLLQETDVNLVVQCQYTFPPGSYESVISQNRSGVSSYFGFDPMHNVIYLTNSSSVITDAYAYKAFGEELNGTQPTTNPFRFGGAVGYYRDFANRFKAWYRDGDATIGRWLSRDPLIDPLFKYKLLQSTVVPQRNGSATLQEWYGGPNHHDEPFDPTKLYPYVGNNPLRYVDPTGLIYPFGPIPPGYCAAVAAMIGIGIGGDCLGICLIATGGVGAVACAFACAVIGAGTAGAVMSYCFPSAPTLPLPTPVGPTQPPGTRPILGPEPGPAPTPIPSPCPVPPSTPVQGAPPSNCDCDDNVTPKSIACEWDCYCRDNTTAAGCLPGNSMPTYPPPHGSQTQ